MSAPSIRWGAISLVLAVAACQTPAPEAPGELAQEDLAALDSLRSEYAAAMLAGSWANLAALYTGDAVRMPPNAAAQEGRAAIETAQEQEPEVITEFTLTPHLTTGAATFAFERGSYAVTLTREGSSEPVSDQGKYLVVARKQADGSWLIAQHIWNSNLPLTQPPAAAGDQPSGN